MRPYGTLITRLRLDAALYAPAPARLPGQRGRVRLKGERLPLLSQLALDPRTDWQPPAARGRQQRVAIATGTALWYHSGKPPVPIR